MSSGNWINSVDCFHQAQLHTRYYSNYYCTGNLLIQLSSYVIFAQATALLVWHFQRKSIHDLSTFKSSATWLLILLVIFELIVMVRYTFNLYAVSILYDVLLVLGEMLSSVITFLVCYYFTKKASLLLENQEKTLTFLNWFIVVCIAVFVVTAIVEYVQVGIWYKGK